MMMLDRRTEPAPLPNGFMLDDDEKLVRQPELVHDGYPRDGIGVVIGQSGSGKTVVATHAAVCISSGEPFFGREVVEQVGCVHLAYENGGNIKHRVRAARLHAGFDERTPNPFIYAARSGDLFDAKHFDETVRALKACGDFFESRFRRRLGLVTIDTASAAFIMQDENSNAEIAKVCKVLKALADEVRAFVQAVHHMGKDPKAGARGGSAWRANVDFSISCLADRNPLTAECSNHRLVIDKNRDGPEGPLGAFALIPVVIGEDDRGAISALAAEFTGQAKVSVEATAGAPRIVTFHRAFDEALHLDSRPHSILQGGGVQSAVVQAVSAAVVRGEFYRRWATGEEDHKKAQNARRTAFTRALKDLATEYGREVLRTGEELLWRA